ncbi:hypothetical protein O7635_34055 [Asanoa sp. WMMD1127]|uniref:hypothetical protein n=1 Tax=Asanoa sp. WMMD1127 TaxID=3016107 RepID=UPI002416DDCB|nr:hypothetical protein [Asanoa sp. WMMD1127]MDG4826898.1 hypothetical protein [Asanoa sp. WMMD1127]
MLTTRQWRACLVRTTLVATALVLLLAADDAASWPIVVLTGYLALTAAVLGTLWWRSFTARASGHPALRREARHEPGTR